jgi:hypothetical protein
MLKFGRMPGCHDRLQVDVWNDPVPRVYQAVIRPSPQTSPNQLSEIGIEIGSE